MNTIQQIINFIKGIFMKKQNIPHLVYSNDIRELNDLEREILKLVNNYRMTNGKNILLEDKKINSVCYRNNLRMINDGIINHNGSSYRFDEIKEVCNANYVSENLAYNYNTAESVVAAWLKSKSHLEIILYNNITHFGISVINDSFNKKNYTIMFANEK